jgi:hypothetical protein
MQITIFEWEDDNTADDGGVFLARYDVLRSTAVKRDTAFSLVANLREYTWATWLRAARTAAIRDGKDCSLSIHVSACLICRSGRSVDEPAGMGRFIAL